MKNPPSLSDYKPTGDTFATRPPKVGDLALCPFADQVLQVMQVQPAQQVADGFHSQENRANAKRRWPRGRVLLRQHKGQLEYVHAIGSAEAAQCRYVTYSGQASPLPGGLGSER